MDTSVLLWFFAFAVGALLFFGTATVITIIGAQDLKDLLSKSKKKVRPDAEIGKKDRPAT
ncbi:MAG TPA: hypothetical protein VMH23_11440 [Bacteroidota bacterium]|nr:hypothetical protein [Bacteroidota bacterium]